jgi:hypothetical protein
MTFRNRARLTRMALAAVVAVGVPLTAGAQAN